MTELSDEQLSLIFTDAGFDGRWSPLTGLLRILHNSTQTPLFLDRNWCLTSQDFSCPVCELQKPDLIRPEKQALVASLHIDHDHLADKITGFGKELGLEGAPGELFRRHLSYEPVIVCRACNHIDSILKTLYPDIDPHFSFPPALKKSLIRKRRPSGHLLSTGEGYRLWCRQKESFLSQQSSWEQEIMDLSGGSETFRPYNPKKDILSRASRRYIRALTGYNLSQEFFEFIRRSISWPIRSLD